MQKVNDYDNNSNKSEIAFSLYYFLLAVCSYNISSLKHYHFFRYITMMSKCPSSRIQ